MTPNLLLALYARPLLHGYAVRKCRRHRDLLSLDEIRSLADEGIFEACRRFDETRGEFIGFARFWVRRQLNRAIAHEMMWQRRRVGEGDQLYESEVGERAALGQLEEEVSARDLVSRLEPTTHELWSMHSQGSSLRKLAAAFGMSIRQVRLRLALGRLSLGEAERSRTVREVAVRAFRRAARRRVRPGTKSRG